jgi:hypothetical protein
VIFLSVKKSFPTKKKAANVSIHAIKGQLQNMWRKIHWNTKMFNISIQWKLTALISFGGRNIEIDNKSMMLW